MIDHMTLPVSDYPKSKTFYISALKPLNFDMIMEYGNHGGIGEHGKPEFWIAPMEIGKPTHVAFNTKDRGAVDAFYAAAMAAGGKDNGKPGIRKDYHPNYYAAFVLDPDGHNIEVVCHESV